MVEKSLPPATGAADSGLAAAALVLPPEAVRLREDEFHILHLIVNGQEYHDVRPVRAFPISGKADFIGFMDTQGKETALVARPHKMDKESRKALDRAFARMYYIPKIVHIRQIEETWGVSHWQVQTDRGYATFEVVDRDYIRKLGNGRFLILDVDGNRYEIENAACLDEHSRTLLHSEI